jgi:hypothetical protein
MMPDAALALLQEGDPAGALALLEVAGEQQSNAEALVVRGMVQLANHRPEQALPVLRRRSRLAIQGRQHCSILPSPSSRQGTRLTHSA